MKKLVMAAAIICCATFVHAASIGWNIATGSTTYANDAYMVFVIGQNGVASIDTITALLDDGASVDSYVFGTGNIGANGTGTVAANASGKTLGAGTYTSFAVIFDGATPTVGTSQYAVISGNANQTKTIAGTTASAIFATGNVASTLSNASNWNSYGAVPEPTSGLLMLLGLAGLALKRKRA